MRPPSPWAICTHEGNAARRRLVVNGIASTVVVNLLTTSFWKRMTGRMPACSEPRVGLRLANHTSPRLTVMVPPLVLNLRHNPTYPLQPEHYLRPQTRHTGRLTVLRQAQAWHQNGPEISERRQTRQPVAILLHSSYGVPGLHVP